MTRLAFIDVETVSVKPGPSTIWELAVITRDPQDTGAGDLEYLWHIRPDLTEADPAALRIGGYYERCQAAGWAGADCRMILCPTDDFPDEKPAPMASRQAAATIARLLDGAHLIATNPGFDAGHLDAFLRARHECPAWDYHLTDIGSMVRGRFAADSAGPVPLPWPLKVSDAAALAGIDPDSYEAHTALGDARLVRDVFDAVAGQVRAA